MWRIEWSQSINVYHLHLCVWTGPSFGHIHIVAIFVGFQTLALLKVKQFDGGVVRCSEKLLLMETTELTAVHLIFVASELFDSYLQYRKQKLHSDIPVYI